jgi:hypothetical protein
VSVLDHVLALLAEHDLRHNSLREADSLRYQQRFDASKTALKTALLAADSKAEAAVTAAQKAVDKAATATEKRFESVNEFRQALTDQTATFPSRVELEALSGKIDDLKERITRAEGRSTGLSDGTRLLIQLGGLLVAALTLYFALKQ